MTQLGIHLLGNFHVTDNGQTLKGLDQARLQALLSYLLLYQDAPVSRQQLAYTFWPESDEKQALNNLRTLFYRLRQALPDAESYLSYDRHTLQWRPAADFSLDVEEFERALARAQTAEQEGDLQTMGAELEQAAALYVGDLLPANYDAWIEAHRERLKQDYEAAIERLIDYFEEDGQYEQAIAYARQLVQQNPLSETAYRRLMALQAASGNRAGALQTFQQAQKMLAESLGVDPSPETLALHIQTLQGEIGLGNVERAEQARQVARQREELDGRYERLINTNVLLLELQREREEKSKLLSRLEEGLAETSDRSFLEDQPGQDIPCPYKGLAAYDEADAAYFFGREGLVGELAARLAGTPFLTVVGPSGSGKSSLVRAGLLPALKAGGLPGSESWKTAVVTPGAHPLATLAVAMAQFNGATAGKLYRALQEEPCALAEAVAEALEAAGGEAGMLLVVDQFEELFALCRDDAERRLFVENVLCAASEATSRLMVLLTVRADFYGRFGDFPALAATQKDSLLIGAMDEAGMRAVIEKPAALVGLQLEPGLADTILEDAAGEPGALPLLSHALLETFRRREGRLLTLEGYRSSGGIRGAIAQTADSVYQNMSAEEQAITRGIFLRLTELGEEGAQDTRRRVEPGELVLRPEEETAVLAVLKMLADARLITTGEETVEVAHEALIREWPLLREWLEADREGLRIHRHLTETAQAWDELERDPGELYRGARLAVAAEWAARHDGDLNQLEQEFLAESEALVRRRETEREAQRQRELLAAQRLAAEEQARADEQAAASKRLRRRAGYLTGALIAAAVLALAALLLGRQANSSQALAMNNAATAVAESMRRATAQAAAEFQEQEARAQEAVAVAQSEQRATAQAQAEFQEAQAREQQAKAETEAEQRATAQANAELQQQEAERQRNLATSRQLASASQVALGTDPELSILLALQGLRTAYSREGLDSLHLALTYPVVEQTLAGHTQGDVTDIMYTADGSRLFTAGRDGLVKLWDAEKGEELRTFTGHTAAVVKIALSADGTRLATAGADSTAKVWDIETGEELQTFVGHNLWVFGVAFSPDGERLATAAEDGLVKIWDIATGVEQLNLDGHSDLVNELSFTPDGARLITASSDGTVKVWDASTGRELASLTGHDNGVFGMAFSPDWSAMVTESFDQTIKVWDLAQVESGGSDALMLTVDRNTNATSNATRITFSPDGLRILALEDDSITSEWDVASGQLLRRIPCGAGNGFTIAVSPDGEHLAAASELGQATICSLLPAGELLALELADDVYDVNLSPDGTRLYAAAGGDGIKVWNFDQSDAETFGQLVGSVDAGEAGVFFKAIASQDGSQVAIAGADGITRILASDSLEELMTLSGHDHIVTDTTFNHAGSRLATASFDNKGKMWDLESGQELFTLDGHSDAVIQIIFSEDEKYLVTSSFDGTARIWDAETGQELQKLDLGISVRPLSFSPDGRILAIGSGNEIVLYDFTGWVESGVMRELGRLSGHTGSLIAAHFSPSGKYLATGATDHSAKIWDVATGRTLTTLEGNENWVRDVEFSLDESMLVTAGADGTVRAYYLDPDTLSEVAQSRLTRWFTPLECQEYLNSDECPPAPWEDGN